MGDYAETALVRSMHFLAESQAAIAHNLANLETAGFKRRLPHALPVVDTFAAMLERPMPTIQFAPHTDWSNGTLTATGEKLHLALEGQGFFWVEGEDGNRFLTRNGAMMIDRGGQLTTTTGHRVLDANGQRIALGSNATVDAGRIAISPTGAITADGAPVGQLAIVAPVDPQQLQPIGESLWLDRSSKTPLAKAQTKVRQGFLERSNVESLGELVQMIAIQRGFEANARALSTLGRIESGYINSLNR